jgi:hypothetical protein
VVARARVGPAGWSAGIDELLSRIAGRFGRIECRQRVRAFLVGLLAGVSLHGDGMVLTGTGALGSYTTFSTWMLETQRLGEERQTWAAMANIVVSVVLGMAAALLGQWIADRI